MSRHRELIHARQEVLHVVGKFLHDYGYMSQHREMQEAWEKYDALRNDLSGPGASSPRYTSIASGAHDLPLKESVRRRVIESVTSHYRVFDDGMTTSEIENRLRRSHQTVSSAVNFCETAGWLKDSGKRRNTNLKRPAIVYVPTDLALEVMTR